MEYAETVLTVRYAETDRMGVVHHSNYPIWFEAGRTDMIRKAGYPYSKVEENGLLLPLIELRCYYKGSARYEDVVTVRTYVCEVTPTRIHFRYDVLVNGNPSPICEGDTYHVWTNKDLKPVNLRKVNPEIYGILCGMSGTKAKL